MPSCIVAFHVTCAFDHNLEMRTILAENDEVRFKSFCLEHSCTANNSSTASSNTSALTTMSNGNQNATTSTTNGEHGTSRPDLATTGVNSEVQLGQEHQPNSSSDGEQRSTLYAVSMSAPERADREQLEREKVSQRKQKLQELEDEFYRLVDPREVAENLALPVLQVHKSTEL